MNESTDGMLARFPVMPTKNLHRRRPGSASTTFVAARKKVEHGGPSPAMTRRFASCEIRRGYYWVPPKPSFPLAVGAAL